MSVNEKRKWSLEEQEWWKKYSAMVQAGQHATQQAAAGVSVSSGSYIPMRSSGSYAAYGSYRSSGYRPSNYSIEPIFREADPTSGELSGGAMGYGLDLI